uniref:Uncharacterized protein n=1 Tax=Arundo donax TaxID=35708 RepID=A0A0A8ZYJ9_ARUDO
MKGLDFTLFPYPSPVSPTSQTPP